MLRNKFGFFLSGLINNYNFVIIFSCAYSLSQNNKYINPSLIILSEIIPGFITQILYPKYLYKIPYTYRWILLYFTQIISSLLLLLRHENFLFLFTAICLVSINSYLGESSMLSMSSFYEQKEMKFWSMGTGMAGLCGTGFYLLMNYWLNMRIIFGINLILYLFVFSIGLYLLDYRNHVNQNKENINDIQNKENINDIPLSNNDFNLEEEEIKNNPSYFVFFLSILPLCLSYFLSYFIGFGYIPLLVKTDFEYQLGQFITRTSMFLGRISGNYIVIQKIKLFGFIHVYSFILLVIFSFTIQFKIQIPFMITYALLTLTYFINGVTYPIVYNYIYRNYLQEKEWYMGAVGQFTAFFTILGCLFGYPLQLLWSN